MATPEPTAITKISDFMRSEIVRARFAEVIGKQDAGAYIASALLAVANSESLQACTPQSIYTAALQSATLRLSVEPALGQAYLVPFGKKATLIVGYKGLLDMAVRTGKYRYINVGPVYEGEEVKEDRISGFHSLAGHRTGDRVIGWLAAFELDNRKGSYAKTVYMTVEEIHEHAQKYSKSYNNPRSGWQTDKAKMERKTVLRLTMRKWGYLDPADIALLEEVEHEAGENGSVVEGTSWDVPDQDEAEVETRETPRQSEEQNMADLGFASEPEAQSTQPAPEIARPYPPEIFKAKLGAMATTIKSRIADGKARPCTDNARKVLAAALGKVWLAKEQTERYETCLWLTGESSTKKIPGEFVIALLRVMEVENFDDEPLEASRQELIQAHSAALIAAGQQILPLA